MPVVWPNSNTETILSPTLIVLLPSLSKTKSRSLSSNVVVGKKNWITADAGALASARPKPTADNTDASFLDFMWVSKNESGYNRADISVCLRPVMQMSCQGHDTDLTN